MVTRVYYVISAISLLLFLTLVPLETQSKAIYANPSGFLKSLEGCKKGQKVEGIPQLKGYLTKFGYLENHQEVSEVTSTMKNISENENENLFDDSLEKAIKMYQFNYGLNVTGHLDVDTIKQMMKPRCGFADIINGHNTMQRMSKTIKSRMSLYEASYYSVIGKKWPPSEYKLTYKIMSINLVPGAENMNSIVNDALNKWAQYSPFTFEEVNENNGSNLFFAFCEGDHWDGHPFDGPGGTIAHSFPPTIGASHYDAAENWSDDPGKDQLDLNSVVLHEIGHLLGLAHTQDSNAVMHPVINLGERKRELQSDDIEGIHFLYGTN